VLVLQGTIPAIMPNVGIWLIALSVLRSVPSVLSSGGVLSVLSSGGVPSVLSSGERCDMCNCSLVSSTLLLNCSDLKTRPNSESGTIRQPYPDSYAHFAYKTIEACFERNSIEKLVHLSLVGASSLSLAQNKISVIEEGTFIKLTTLRALSLKRNELQTLNDKVFLGLKNLEVLDLSENRFTNVHPRAFVVLNSLKSLDLSQNLIEALQEKEFAISTLETLDVSFNRIAQIAPNAFENAVNLMKLNLSNNNVSAVGQHRLESLTSLQILDLSHNQIVSMDPSALVKSLKWLSLSWNELEMVPQNLGALAGLQVLGLAGNSLNDLGEALKSLELQELHVQENFLQNISVNRQRLRVRRRIFIVIT
jgi:Leucine-rich repeat (LRR) protein